MVIFFKTNIVRDKLASPKVMDYDEFGHLFFWLINVNSLSFMKCTHFVDVVNADAK